MRKRILWIQTGGTFSCAGTKSGLAPQSSEEQAVKILALMPQVCEKYDIVPMTLMNIDSSDMTISRSALQIRSMITSGNMTG